MTPLELAKARLIELGERHDASRPAAVHPLWRAGGMAGMGLLAGVLLAGRKGASKGNGPGSTRSAIRLAMTVAPWLASFILRR
ncbi:MAG: hypothetical protein WCK33_07660 [Phycisphaerae bacterium]|jgi:hypothetical protein